MVDGFIKKYIIAGSVAAILVTLVFNIGFPQLCSIPLIFSPVLATVVSVLMVRMLSNPSLSALLKFNSMFMLFNMLKMLVYLAYFIISYLCIDVDKRLTFVVAFVAIYIIYLVFDTATLLSIFKDKDKS